MITMKRAYDAVSRTDGTRFLVERLWPRGLSKATLRLDGWLKEVGPSTELRKWFRHDPDKWDEFRRRYFRELASQPEAWQPIVSAARRGRVTLVYSSHDTQHNNAVALQQFLRKKAHRPARSKRTSGRRSRRPLVSIELRTVARPRDRAHVNDALDDESRKGLAVEQLTKPTVDSFGVRDANSPA
jgi:uncharacterized protein YeaO (DUF488 family)